MGKKEIGAVMVLLYRATCLTKLDDMYINNQNRLRTVKARACITTHGQRAESREQRAESR